MSFRHRAARPSAAWLLLPLVAALGCTAKTEAKKAAPKSTLPAAKADSELAGRYLLVLGNASTNSLKQPFTRWCYLDVQVEGTNKLLVDAWRPDDQEVDVKKAVLKHDGQIQVTIARTWIQGGEEEIEATETWKLTGFLRDLPRTVKRKPKRKRGDDEDEDEEEEEEDEDEEEEERVKGLVGQAVVTLEEGRTTKFKFTGTPVAEDEEQPWEEEPSRRRTRKPTLAELEKLHKAGKLDFESIPPELKDEARKRFGS